MSCDTIKATARKDKDMTHCQECGMEVPTENTSAIRGKQYCWGCINDAAYDAVPNYEEEWSS